MKNIGLIPLLISLFFSVQISGHQVSGVASNSETGDPLPGFDILLTFPGGGVAGSATTGPDGTFTLTDIPDGTYDLKFNTYPDPIILNGDYFMHTTYDGQITVSGGNVTGIEFPIPPHHPEYTLTGVLYDNSTQDTISIQDFQVQAKMQHLVEFFTDYQTENGIYILEDMPDWTYELTVFENDYYEGEMIDITIDTLSPDTVQMDFYLEPKMGATISGVLLDSTNNQPIMQAGRTITLQAINSLFTETNDQGEFTFINVPPGTYSNIHVSSEDTSYVNCTGSEIPGIMVPEEGLEDVELYQKPWISVHEVTADDNMFVPGATKTIRFSIENDDLVYGAIWGVQLQFPEGVTVLNTTPFYSSDNNDVIFDNLPDCSTDLKKDWEGWHFVGIPPYASSEGNLEELNESAWADVTLQFDNDTMREMMPVFYEVFYDIHCFSIQPFSYGNIMLMNDNIFSDIGENGLAVKRVSCYPNPAADQATFQVNLDQERYGEIALFDVWGKKVLTLEPEVFHEGRTETTVTTAQLPEGIYFYSFLAGDTRMTGKLVISR